MNRRTTIVVAPPWAALPPTAAVKPSAIGECAAATETVVVVTVLMPL